MILSIFLEDDCASQSCEEYYLLCECSSRQYKQYLWFYAGPPRPPSGWDLIQDFTGLSSCYTPSVLE